MFPFNNRFTQKEFLFWWIPTMIVGAFLMTAFVVAGTYDVQTGVLIEVILGVVTAAAAKWINPPTAASETDKEVTSGE